MDYRCNSRRRAAEVAVENGADRPILERKIRYDPLASETRLKAKIWA
ncbi:MAG: hypothetical protein LBI57_03245 [Helicobacteraceae bacterium]|jgi:hypothetical protein|nr:hypothetical protein [Helicobacteraceae bacterium]